MTRFTENGHEPTEKMDFRQIQNGQRASCHPLLKRGTLNFRFFSVSATSARIHGRRSEHVRRGRSAGARGARVAGGESMVHIQGSAKRLRPGLVNCVPAVAYHFCLNLPRAFSQPGKHSFGDPCTRRRDALLAAAEVLQLF